MWLILAQDGDVEARWLADQLRTETTGHVQLIEAGELVHECRWEHRIGTTVTSSLLITGDGTVIDSGDVDGVVNRLIWLSAEGYEGAPPGDREYASNELFALGLSWLESLGPRVLNRPAGAGLSGPWRTQGHWHALARAAGLPIVPYDSDRDDDVPDQTQPKVLVIGGQVIGPMAVQRAGQLAAFQRGSGLDMLEVCLDAHGAMHGVSFLPALRQYGQACVQAVLAALTRPLVMSMA
jgi:hypothetical protein